MPDGTKQLKITYVGFSDLMVNVQNRTNIDCVLKEDAQMLDEVVAIGYAKVRKADLTGSTVSVGGKDLASRPVATAAEALQGKAAGVNIVSQSGAPGADVNITVRGGTSITQSTTPLYIVDGFEMENALQQIDINDIETIDIMKDASATAIYGARGANGVIIITTKSARKERRKLTITLIIAGIGWVRSWMYWVRSITLSMSMSFRHWPETRLILPVSMVVTCRQPTFTQVLIAELTTCMPTVRA